MNELAACSYKISSSSDSTLAIEVTKIGLRRRRQKYTLRFDKFEGEMTFAKGDPPAFRLAVRIDPRSGVCCDAHLSKRRRRAIADFARKALTSDPHRDMTFTAQTLQPKPIRGYAVDGVLQIGGITRVIKANTVMSPVRQGWLQLDGDAMFRLSDFDLPRPSSLFGLFNTKDEVDVRLLLWAAPVEV
jgi:polyisoprenoid-binding protein YceI